MEIKAVGISSEMSLEFIKSFSIASGDVILIEINHLEMPASHYRDHANAVKTAFNECFPDNKCLVIPKGNISVSIISPEDAVTTKLSCPGAV